MEGWETIVITALLSLITAIITSLVTTSLNYKNTVKKWVLEKRSELYLRFYKNAEELLKNPEKSFDDDYFNEILKVKPEMKLLSSNETFDAFKQFYEFIRNIKVGYNKYCSENNPETDPERVFIGVDEDGEPYEDRYVTEEDMNDFYDNCENYKENNMPKTEEISRHIELLYQAMRDDLGSNLKT